MRCSRVSRRSAGPGRSGFSLIEVILATALLLGSVVVLYRLIGMGRTSIQKAQQTAQAQRICENLLSELTAGLRPLRAVESEPLHSVGPDSQPGTAETVDETMSDDGAAGQIILPGKPQDSLPAADGRSRWKHTIRFRNQPDMPGLLNVTVTVWSGDAPTGRPVRFSLSRWLRRNDAAGGQAVSSQGGVF